MNLLLPAIQVIVDQLNTSLRISFPSPDDWVVLSNLTNSQGDAETGVEDKIVVSVCNLTTDEAISRHTRTATSKAGTFASTTAPLNIDVTLLITANFPGTGYGNGLELLSATIAFLHSNPVFTHQNTPQLADGIDQLSIEMLNLSEDTLAAVMSAHRARYLPMVCYKIRTVPFVESAQKVRPAITSKDIG